MRNLVILVIASVVALASFGCVGETPTGPTHSADLSINPVSVHMKVGDVQVFTAEGIKGLSYNFKFDDNTSYHFFNVENIAPNKIKLTLVRDASKSYIYAILRVDAYSVGTSYSAYAESFIYFD